MASSVFQYPGGKSYLAPWIIEHMADHYCYVELFAGSAAVLVNKPRSGNEVINDRDGDVVQFFEVLRDRGDELVEWLNDVPYARDLHQEWGADFYSGDRPDDPIERAGRFFFLRNSQFSGVYDHRNGFSSAAVRNKAGRFANNREGLREFKERFDRVQIENCDYAEIVDRFDSEETLFYADPPYVSEGDALYNHGEFDHSRFVETVSGIEGKFLISYSEPPDGLDEYHAVQKGRRQFLNKNHDNETRSTDATETLVMNYDPQQTPSFAGANQATLTGAME